MTLLAHDLDLDLDLTPLTWVNGGGPRQLLSCPLFDDGQTLFVARLCCPEVRKGEWLSSMGPPQVWDVSCRLFWSDGCSLGLPLQLPHIAPAGPVGAGFVSRDLIGWNEC